MIANPFNLSCFDHLLDLFQSQFEKELIDEICMNGKLRKIDKNVELISIGDSISHMPLIVSGSLKVMTEGENGEELLLYYLEFGNTCAMTLKCCATSSQSTISAMTEKPSEILFIPVEYMEKWMIKYHSWRAFVLESYNTRMNEMLQAIDNLAFHNMEERLFKYLHDRALVLNDGELKITHLQIANDLNSSRVVISRLMKKLEQEGVIKQYRNRVELLK